MEIRELLKTELNDLNDLYCHLHEEDDPIPEEPYLDIIWDRIHTNPNYFCLGAFAQGKLISSCCLIIIENLTRGCRPYAIIENVVTHRNSRRKGYGKLVLRHALDLAWGSNCYKVMLQTSRLDEGTFQFYETVGFDRNAKQAFVAKPSST
jgi:GNAT superfamily N-acetyltransferase